MMTSKSPQSPREDLDFSNFLVSLQSERVADVVFTMDDLECGFRMKGGVRYFVRVKRFGDKQHSFDVRKGRVNRNLECERRSDGQSSVASNVRDIVRLEVGS